MRLSETAQEIIKLAAEVRSYWSRELPKRHPHFPMVSPGEDSGPPPPEKQRLRELLLNLPPDAIYQLALIMYLGRGDFDATDLAQEYDNVRSTFAKPSWAATQMLEKAPLADYLSDGLTKLHDKGFDVDHLPLAKAS
jgi:hypothetical protein